MRSKGDSAHQYFATLIVGMHSTVLLVFLIFKKNLNFNMKSSKIKILAIHILYYFISCIL